MRSLPALTLLATLALASPAMAGTIVPVSATASSSFNGYGAQYAIDTGAGSLDTDWAANGTGVGSFIDLDLGAVYQLSDAQVTDRTTSGGGNGSFVGGLFDFTTEFSIQVFSNASFTTPVGAPIDFTKSDPSVHTSPSDFLFIAELGGLTGEYIRYTVLATNGVNPGLANIQFDGYVPEPASLALFGVGLGALAMGRRKRA